MALGKMLPQRAPEECHGCLGMAIRKNAHMIDDEDPLPRRPITHSSFPRKRRTIESVPAPYIIGKLDRQRQLRRSDSFADAESRKDQAQHILGGGRSSQR